MRVPDAISRIDWPAGWVDGGLLDIDGFGLKLGADGSATILTCCTTAGTSLLALVAPGMQRVARMRAVETPLGMLGAPLEVEHTGKPMVDRRLVDAWGGVERAFAAARAAAEDEFNGGPGA